MNIKLVSYTDDAETVCALAGKLCYSPYGLEQIKKNLNQNKIGGFLKKIINSGHLSVIEHAAFSFMLEGISRACTHQLVRHRIASYSQKSQRYVDEKQLLYITPQTIKDNKELNSIYHEFMTHTQKIYEKMIAAGIPKEDARFVLPNAAETKIFVTMNGRELYHFFEKRLCLRAQWEIREVAEHMLEQVKQVAPNIFQKAGPACVNGPCPEGKLNCGEIKEMRQKYGANK